MLQGSLAVRILHAFKPAWKTKSAEAKSFFANLTNGYVVDFLDFSFPWIVTEAFPNGYHWPSFNVADSCVCIAAGLFLIASFMPQPEKKEENKA